MYPSQWKLRSYRSKNLSKTEAQKHTGNINTHHSQIPGPVLTTKPQRPEARPWRGWSRGIRAEVSLETTQTKGQGSRVTRKLSATTKLKQKPLHFQVFPQWKYLPKQEAKLNFLRCTETWRTDTCGHSDPERAADTPRTERNGNLHREINGIRYDYHVDKYEMFCHIIPQNTSLFNAKSLWQHILWCIMHDKVMVMLPQSSERVRSLLW